MKVDRIVGSQLEEDRRKQDSIYQRLDKVLSIDQTEFVFMQTM